MKKYFQLQARRSSLVKTLTHIFILTSCTVLALTLLSPIFNLTIGNDLIWFVNPRKKSLLMVSIISVTLMIVFVTTSQPNNKMKFYIFLLSWALCSTLVLASYHASLASALEKKYHAIYQQALYNPQKALEKFTLYQPSLPSLHRIYTDRSWKNDIHIFQDFYTQAEKRRMILQPELEAIGMKKELAQVTAYMLFVSSLWGYGNIINPHLPGCVLINEENNWIKTNSNQISASTYAQSNIGCCTDYANILLKVLYEAGIEARLTTIPGHIFNEVKVNDRWHVIDANANLVINQAWDRVTPSPDTVIYQFPHPGGEPGALYRPAIPAFQASILVMIATGLNKQVEHPSLGTSIQ